MMRDLTTKELTRLSKLMSLVLRHKPEELGLKLDDSGWVSMHDLLRGLKLKGYFIDAETIMKVVETNDKKRFETKNLNQHIRASQGHSVEVDLGYTPVEPPEILYHGTSTSSLRQIFEQGLLPGKRQAVHLSSSYETATKVGARHGEPYVLRVPALALHLEGQLFYHTPNDVWLTDKVAPLALKAG